MRRHQVRPFGHSITPTRTVTMLMSLAAIGMLYSWVRQPATWQWAAETDDSAYAADIQETKASDTKSNKAAAAPQSVAKVEPPKETIVPGPNDLDPDELKVFKSRLELLDDKAPLLPREMSLYWKLMGWARTEPFQKMESRANGTTSFSQVWEQPEKYRGKLLRLRMHVRRVLHYEAPENPIGVKNCYEIWGWTEDSKSFPYVIVVPELPPGLKVGPDVRGEIVFVGYFLKIMFYKAFDVPRGAPLLLGRVRGVTRAVASEPINSPSSMMYIAIGALVVFFAGVTARFLSKLVKRRKITMLPDSLDPESAFAVIPNDRSLPVMAGGEDASFDGGDSAEPRWKAD